MLERLAEYRFGLGHFVALVQGNSEETTHDVVRLVGKPFAAGPLEMYLEELLAEIQWAASAFCLGAGRNQRHMFVVV